MYACGDMHVCMYTCSTIDMLGYVIEISLKEATFSKEGTALQAVDETK